MKTKMILGLLAVSGLIGSQAVAQEYDDMYFNSKDRAKLKAKGEVTSTTSDKIDSDYEAFKKKHFGTDDLGPANPSDSYSSRNVNPEFVARSNAEMASEDDSAVYFTQGYDPNLVSTNTNYNPVYSNGYYNMNYPGSIYSPYYSPYANRFSPYYYGNPYGYNPYGYYNPYYSMYSGWNVSFGFGYGSYFNPYCSYYSPYYSFYSPFSYYGYGGGYYSNNDGNYSRSYGKYGSRNGTISTYNPDARISNNGATTGRTRTLSNSRVSGNSTENGRLSSTSTATNTQPDYYNPRSRRSTTSYSGNTATLNRATTTQNRNSFFNNNSSNTRTNSSNFNNTRSSGSNFNSGSRSGGSNFTPAPSRSSSGSGGSGSGGSSGGRKRGGN